MRLKKRFGADDAGKKIVERKNSSGRLVIEKGLIVGAPVSGSRKAEVIRDVSAEEGQAPERKRAPLLPKKDRSLLRREDYADIYQVGRRVSSTQKLSARASRGAAYPGGAPAARTPRSYGKPFGRLPQSQQGGGAPTGMAPLAAPAAAPGKKFNARRLAASIACAALITAATLVIASASQPRPALALGQQVFFDGRMLGIVQSREEVEGAMLRIHAELKGEYGMEVQQSGQLSFSPVHCDDQNIMDEADIVSALKSNIDVKVVASVITVNGHPAVALRTEEEARQALEAVLAPYRNVPADRYRTDIGFVEDVQVQQMPIDFDLVKPMEEAIRALTFGAGVEDNVYTVVKGDTLGKIAKKFNLKISDIRRANPDLTSDVIQPGQTLNAVRPASWVNVRYTEQVERQETLPFKTVEQSDETLYTTQTDVKQEGRNGQRSVWAKITYVNGIEAQEEVTSQTVITPAQDKIVLKGTKKVPANAGNGGGTAVSGKFTVPVKSSYRISSRFGPRNLAGAASNYHYGIDLAAPTGTPFYASRAGTVSYAGSASGYGLVIYIDHGDGTQTRYGHCSKLLVKKGQKVSQGQLIGLVGATGDATGPHLHFEIRVNGAAVNPEKYVKF